MKFAFGPLVKTICKLSGFLFACYTGTMLLWQIVSLQYISMFSCLLCHIWEKISKSVCIFNLICLKIYCIIEKHEYHCLMPLLFFSAGSIELCQQMYKYMYITQELDRIPYPLLIMPPVRLSLYCYYSSIFA